jgi:hypothetical protein
MGCLVPDYVVLFGSIVIGGFVLAQVDAFIAFVYWKYVGWKYGNKEEETK